MNELIKEAFTNYIEGAEDQFPTVTVNLDSNTTPTKWTPVGITGSTPQTNLLFEIARAVHNEYDPSDTIKIVGYKDDGGTLGSLGIKTENE